MTHWLFTIYCHKFLTPMNSIRTHHYQSQLSSPINEQHRWAENNAPRNQQSPMAITKFDHGGIGHVPFPATTGVVRRRRLPNELLKELADSLPMHFFVGQSMSKGVVLRHVHDPLGTYLGLCHEKFAKVEDEKCGLDHHVSHGKYIKSEWDAEGITIGLLLALYLISVVGVCLLVFISAPADVWTFEEGVLYRWKDSCWRLIRTEDSTFIWCGATMLELKDHSNGWLYFFLNGRLGTCYNNVDAIGYRFDTADFRDKFISRLHKALAAVPSRAQIESILSVPRVSKKIQSGNWDLSSVEDDTVLVTNRKSNRQLTIKGESINLIRSTKLKK